MKACRALILAAAVVLAGMPGAMSAATRSIDIPAILSLTGAGAFLGQEEQQSLAVIANDVNRNGGVHGRPIRFVTFDDKSSPQVAVELAAQVAHSGAPMMLGPTTQQACAAVLPLIAASGPVMYCLSPGIRPAPGSFAFSAGEETNAIATVVLRYLKSTSQTRFAALTATDGSGQDMDRSLDNALTLPEFKDMKLVAREHFGSADISVVAQTARIQSAQPQVVLVWCAGTPLGTALRAINETGLDVPVITSGANMNQRQIRSYDAFLPRTLLFSSQIAALRNAVGPGPIADAQRHFRRAMSAAGYQADAGYTLSWDPALLLIDALRARGSAATAADIRDFLATTAGWVGIDGIYDFRSTPQRGLDASSGLVSGWNALKDDFEPMSKRAGYPR